MRIYVAGPYRIGDVQANVRRAMEAGSRLLDMGHAPLVPHLNHFWNLYAERPEKDWLELDLAWLHVADAVLRLPGPSAGADAECALARNLEIPVFERWEDVPPARLG